MKNTLKYIAIVLVAIGGASQQINAHGGKFYLENNYGEPIYFKVQRSFDATPQTGTLENGGRLLLGDIKYANGSNFAVKSAYIKAHKLSPYKSLAPQITEGRELFNRYCTRGNGPTCFEDRLITIGPKNRLKWVVTAKQIKGS